MRNAAKRLKSVLLRCQKKKNSRLLPLGDGVNIMVVINILRKRNRSFLFFMNIIILNPVHGVGQAILEIILCFDVVFNRFGF